MARARLGDRFGRVGAVMMLVGLLAVPAGAWAARSDEPVPDLNPPKAEGEDSGKPQGKPDLVTDPPNELYIGQVYYGNRGKADLKIMNEGEGELVIERIKSSCGCTVPRLAEKDKHIPPGGSITVPVTMEPKQAREHRMQKSITIVSNDPDTPEKKILVACDVLVGIEPKPYYVLFRDLLPDETRTQTIELISRRGGPFKIEAIELSRGPYSVEYDREREAASHKITVKVEGNGQRRLPSANMVIRTNHPYTPQLRMRVTSLMKKPLEISPRMINLGRREAGDVAEFTVRVSTAVAEPISRLEVSVPRYPTLAVKARPKDNAPGLWVLQFEIPKALAGQTINTEIQFRTDVAAAETDTCRLRLQVVEPKK